MESRSAAWCFCMCIPELLKWPQEDLFGGADNLQQGQEDLHDVRIDGKSAKHVLLRADRVLPVSDQKLRVVCQELQRQQESSFEKTPAIYYITKSCLSNEYSP